MIDNYDSFTYNLVHYFNELNEDVIVFRNNEITLEQIQILKPDRICLSPGPGRPKEAGICMDLVRNFSKKFPRQEKLLPQTLSSKLVSIRRISVTHHIN